MTTNENTQEKRASDQALRPKRWLVMPMVVAGLLGGHVIFIILAITFATGDRSFAVVPDYYQKSVSFDERKVALAASAELGWSYEFRPSERLDPTDERGVVVVLRDQDGAAVQGAEMSLTGYHLARANDVVSIVLSEVSPGQYVGQGPIQKAGFWQFELVATRGDARFIVELRPFVGNREATR